MWLALKEMDVAVASLGLVELGRVELLEGKGVVA